MQHGYPYAGSTLLRSVQILTARIRDARDGCELVKLAFVFRGLYERVPACATAQAVAMTFVVRAMHDRLCDIDNSFATVSVLTALDECNLALLVDRAPSAALVPFFDDVP